MEFPDVEEDQPHSLELHEKTGRSRRAESMPAFCLAEALVSPFHFEVNISLSEWKRKSMSTKLK